MHPLNTTATSPGFLGPKYENLRTITLEGFDPEEPDSVDAVREWLDFFLPSGFVKDPYFGLALRHDMRFIIDAIEKLHGVTDLRLWRGRVPNPPRVEADRYVIGVEGFHRVRRSIDRAHDKALRIAGEEKRVFVHNTLLTSIDPQRFPETHRPYHKDAIVEAIGRSLRKTVPLSTSDRKAVVAAVASEAQVVRESEPEALLELSNTIEVVTLEDLLARMKDMIGRRLSEATWQSFFTDNSFILRLAFALPIMVIGDKVAVGGRKLSGDGEKFTDFVVKAASSGNLSLVEIKTPTTPLLERHPYRGDLFAPSGELSGAVNQILDQRYQLQRSISGLKDASGVWDIESFAIQGLVIAGRTPADRPQLKSLELFRNGLKSVTILTFDELLFKLEHILEVLRPDQPATDDVAIDDATESNGSPSPADLAEP